MSKAEIKSLIRELTCKKEQLEDEYRTARDEMHRLEGAFGELQVVIWRLDELLGEQPKQP